MSSHTQYIHFSSVHSASRGGSVSSTIGLNSLESSLNMPMGSNGGGLHYDLEHNVQTLDSVANASQIDDLTTPPSVGPMHINNNNNMVSAGPSPSSSISPLHCNSSSASGGGGHLPAPPGSELLPHTSVALAAAAAAAVSSMASIEAIGFIDQQPPQQKLDKNQSEGSPKYISL